MADSSAPWVSNPVAQGLLSYLQIAYPIILLITYLTTFTVHSIATARNDSDPVVQNVQLGPGGKPLPKKKYNQPKKEREIPSGYDFSRSRKLLFEWLQVAVILSLAANVTVVVVHAILARDEGWWCGQAPTVSWDVRCTAIFIC